MKINCELIYPEIKPLIKDIIEGINIKITSSFMLSKKLHNTKTATVRLQNKISVMPPGTLYGGGGHQSIFEERLLIWGGTRKQEL